MFRSKNPADDAFDRLREAIDEEVDPVLDLDDVLLDDQLFALVLANLGQETLDGQLGAAGCFLLGLGDLEALLLKLDGLIQSLEPFVERHQPVIILGNLRDQAGHEVVPPLDWRRSNAALPRPWHCAAPSRCPACQKKLRPNRKSGSGSGKCLPGRYSSCLVSGSQRREAAGFVQPRAGPESDEGKVRPSPRQNLVAGDLDFLIQDLQLPIAGQCLVDQARSIGSLKNSSIPS